MNRIRIGVVFLVSFSITVFCTVAWGGQPDAGDIHARSKGPAAATPGDEIVHASLASFCPDLAGTDVFRDAGLGYVHSTEFARSVFSVANGTSKYSPREVPPDWKATAYGWWTHAATGAKAAVRVPVEGSDPRGFGVRGTPGGTSIRPRILTTIGRQIDYDRESLEAESCDPMLLFHASLDYRDRTGRKDLPLAYPYKVRLASEALDRTIRAKLAAANRLAARADVIGGKIADSERMGAALCQPQELARVKADYEKAVEVATDLERTLEETEAAMARAEESSAELFAQRQFASSRGIPCLHAN